jgi:hypothetical protein
MNNVLTSAEGLSAAIQSIQEEIYTALPAFWEGDIKGFGKVYKNVQNSSDNIPKYYKSSKIFIPEVYNSLKGNYEDVFYDNSKACVFCFLIDDKDSTEDNLVFTTKVKVVFMVNLNMIYPNSIERQDSKAQKDIVEILREINGNYKINEVERGIDNVFNQYTTSGVKFDDIQPLHSFAVNIDLSYYLTDQIDNTQIITEDTSSNAGGNVVVDVNSPPSITVQSNEMFIELDVNYNYQIVASNTPTSYNVLNLINGLTLDSVTGVITGLVTGSERVETMTLQATNEFGTSSRLVNFNLTFDNADDFLAPYDLSASNISADKTAFQLNWKIRDYNRTILLSEVYQQNVLVATVYYEQLNIFTSGGSFNFTGLNGVFDYKVRLKNMDGEYSPFSEILEVDSTQGLVLTNNESNVKTNPGLLNVVSYYKMDAINNDLANGRIIDEIGNNNCNLFNAGLILDSVINKSIVFESSHSSLQSFALKENSNNLSFTDDTVDRPFSISCWFNLQEDNGVFNILATKLGEWNLYVRNGYQTTNFLEIGFNITDSSAGNVTFKSRDKSFPPTSQATPTTRKNQWHHVIVTYNGLGDTEKGSIKIFVNNTYYNSDTNLPSPSVDNYDSMKNLGSNFYIGGDENRADRVSKLKMDETIIFDKVLSKDEINFLYNNGSANSLTP